MFAERRRENILKKLQDNGSVSVNELSQQFEVTKETIRRDLNALDKKGLIKRTHGGATILNNTLETEYKLRKQKNVKEKRTIANKAINFIKSGDVLFIDSSTTCYYLACLLDNFERLTIVTNSVLNSIRLAENTKNSIIIIEGLVRPNNFSCVGNQAIKTIEKYNADIFFASCSGINPELGATNSNYLEAEVKKHMVNKAKKTILLVDHTKFDNVRLSTFAELNEIDKIITDEKINKNITEKYNQINENILM